jgi:hypothetical protein
MIISNKTQNYIAVLQKECVISKTYPIATGVFGPCYILMGYDSNSKYSFLAHIDCCTNDQDIPLIFEKLKELKVKIENLSLKLMGGWKLYEKSKSLGNKIIEQLKNLEVYKNTNTDYLWKKEAHPKKDLSEKDLETKRKYYFFGVVINPKNGEFQFLQKPSEKLSLNQQKIDENFLKKCELINQKIIEITLTAKTIPKILEIEGETIKNFGNNKMVDLRIIAKIYPLKISLI